MSANRLSDYMAASEQARRTILRSCKFRPRARVIQHSEAKESIAAFLSSEIDAETLETRAEIMRSGLRATDFENEVAENNADYIDRFREQQLQLPGGAQEVKKAGRMTSLDLDGFTLSFSPDLLLKRVNRRNVPKIGVAFFRYSRNKPLADEVACWQGAISMGYLTTKLHQGTGDVDMDSERALCVAFDVWTGRTHEAPSNAVYRFKEVRAVCAGIAERWDQIQPPPGAVF